MLSGQQLQRLLAVRRRNRFIARVGQSILHQPPGSFVVLCDQDAKHPFSAPSFLYWGYDTLRLRRTGIVNRENF